MPTITFYRQQRADGGIRTGIDVDGDTVFAAFEPGNGDHDPALLWYVDVAVSGPALTTDPDGARAWLLQHEGAIADLISNAAAGVPAGSDPDDWPMQFSGALDADVSVRISCSAVRRVEARQIGGILRGVGAGWRHHIESLAAAEAA